MPAQIARHLAAAGGVPDVNSILQVEMGSQRREVIGIVIHVMPFAHLRRAAMAAAVMSNDAIAMTEEKQHLRVPVVGGERPAMAEHDGLTFAPEDLNFEPGNRHAAKNVVRLSPPCETWRRECTTTRRLVTPQRIARPVSCG